MCGICGIVRFKSSDLPVDEAEVTRMRETLVHRGPDGGRTWVGKRRDVGFGFRRLAIIDLSEAAMQPMISDDGQTVVVFNGEIYNHAEVREGLIGRGRTRWQTDHSDTEVVLQAYEEWGIDCLARFRGMFAIAVWDERARCLWLARDRIGVKPLYYVRHGGRLSFASEIKALLADRTLPREVDEEALYHYLSFLTTPAPATLFKGIRKLEGGTWLRASADGDVRVERYWDVWNHTEPLTDSSDEEIAERLLEELRRSVALRKVSDVPVGVFLSGGIDSSTNAALFSEGEQSPVRTFSIGYDGDYASYKNELTWARRVADEVGAEHHERILSVDDLLGFLPEMVKLQDEPIADPVCFPVYFVSKLAREAGVVVCQVGEGADELFWGYPKWRDLLRLQELNDLPVPRPFKSGLAWIARSAGLEGRREYEALRRGISGLPIFWSGAEAFTETQKRDQILSQRLRRDLREMSSWDAIAPIRRRFEDRAWETSHLNWMSYVDLNLRLPELLLMRVDKMSMGVSLEGRVPFLDHKFVELALSIPTAVKTRNRDLKYILKRAVRGVIPDEVIDRPKQGFGVPVHEWFFEQLGDAVKRELEAFCRDTDFLDPNGVDKVIRERRAVEAWRLFNFALWWREYVA